jgi:hypothetical protein
LVLLAILPGGNPIACLCVINRVGFTGFYSDKDHGGWHFPVAIK